MLFANFRKIDIYIAKNFFFKYIKKYRKSDNLQNLPQKNFFIIKKFYQKISISESNNNKFFTETPYLIQLQFYINYKNLAKAKISNY